MRENFDEQPEKLKTRRQNRIEKARRRYDDDGDPSLRFKEQKKRQNPNNWKAFLRNQDDED
jgi:hypothetical protein